MARGRRGMQKRVVGSFHPEAALQQGPNKGGQAQCSKVVRASEELRGTLPASHCQEGQEVLLPGGRGSWLAVCLL